MVELGRLAMTCKSFLYLSQTRERRDGRLNVMCRSPHKVRAVTGILPMPDTAIGTSKMSSNNRNCKSSRTEIKIGKINISRMSVFCICMNVYSVPPTSATSEHQSTTTSSHN